MPKTEVGLFTTTLTVLATVGILIGFLANQKCRAADDGRACLGMPVAFEELEPQ